jgi:HSP20 family protein
MAGLAVWKPFNEIDRWRREFDRRLSEMFHEIGPLEATAGKVPAIESFVKDGNLIIRADVPGLAEKDLDLTVLDNVLTIRGERRKETEVKKDEYIRREVAYGSFERRMTLPQATDPDKIKASFKNGVVEITMPIGNEVAARKIPLEAAKPEAAPEARK